MQQAKQSSQAEQQAVAQSSRREPLRVRIIGTPTRPTGARPRDFMPSALMHVHRQLRCILSHHCHNFLDAKF